MPETSRIANDLKTDESKQRDYDRIVVALKKIGSGHYEDIALAMGEKELNVVSRRLSEMVQKGMVENTGLKKNTSRNRPAFIYQLPPPQTQSRADLTENLINQTINKPNYSQPKMF